MSGLGGPAAQVFLGGVGIVELVEVVELLGERVRAHGLKRLGEQHPSSAPAATGDCFGYVRLLSLPAPRGGFAYGRSRPHLPSVQLTADRVAVEARRLELAHDHPDVLLAEVLSPVARNRDHNAGFVPEAPMARSLPAEFGKAVID